MRQISLTKDSQKFLEGLPPKQFRQAVLKIFDLAKNPQPHDSQTLKGYDFYRADVGEYRIIYRFDDVCLYVAYVGKRNDDDIYKKMKR